MENRRFINSITPVNSPNEHAAVSNRKILHSYMTLKKLLLLVGLVLGFLFVLGAFITFLVLYILQRNSEADYGLSCLTARCIADKRLVCVSNICQCGTSTSWNSSTLKCDSTSVISRDHGQTCNSKSTCICSGCSCISSVCQCDSSTKYWNGTMCQSKKTYLATCTTRTAYSYSPTTSTLNCLDTNECQECLSSKSLYCSSATSKCQCPNSTYYYDSSTASCISYGGYYSSCSSNTQCNSNLGFTCQTSTGSSATNCPYISVANKCDCARDYYYDSTSASCQPKKTYGRSCSNACECNYRQQGLVCLQNLCVCPYNFYYDGSTCRAQKTYDSACSSNLECRTDLNLVCNSSKCACSPSNYYWSVTNKMCYECPGGWNFISSLGRCYLFSTSTMTFTDAATECESYAATLARINTNTIKNALDTYRVSNNDYWFDLNYENGNIYTYYTTGNSAPNPFNNPNMQNSNNGFASRRQNRIYVYWESTEVIRNTDDTNQNQNARFICQKTVTTT